MLLRQQRRNESLSFDSPSLSPKGDQEVGHAHLEQRPRGGQALLHRPAGRGRFRGEGNVLQGRRGQVVRPAAGGAGMP